MTLYTRGIEFNFYYIITGYFYLGKYSYNALYWFPGCDGERLLRVPDEVFGPGPGLELELQLQVSRVADEHDLQVDDEQRWPAAAPPAPAKVRRSPGFNSYHLRGLYCSLDLVSGGGGVGVVWSPAVTVISGLIPGIDFFTIFQSSLRFSASVSTTTTFNVRLFYVCLSCIACLVSFFSSFSSSVCKEYKGNNW